MRKLLFEPLENRCLLSGAEIAVFDRALEIPDGATVDFGVVPPNDSYGITKTFTVKNTGDAELSLTLPAVAPVGFFIPPSNAGQYSYIVQAGQELTFDVSLQHSGELNASGTISIDTNDADEDPFVLGVKGQVTANPAPPAQIINDGETGFTATAGWTKSTGGYKNDVRTIAGGTAGQTATWEFGDLPNGLYRIWATWPATGGVNWSTNVTYQVWDGYGDGSGRGDRPGQNQQNTPNDLNDAGTSWKDLGDADIMSGTLRVTLDASGITGELAADAIRIQRISDLTSIVEFTIDDGSAGFSVEGSGWTMATGGYENDLRTNAAGSGADKAFWTFNVSPGTYEVWATWYPKAGTSGAPDAPFTVFDGQTPRGTVQVNQRAAPDEFHDGWNWWKSLGGPYEITTLSTQALVVQLADNAGGTVIADAVRVKRILLPAPVAGPEIDVRSGAMSLSDGGTLSFGSTPPGEAVQKALTVKNVGSDPLDLTSLSGLPDGFSITPPFAARSLGSGESVSYTLSLQSDTPGTYHGTLSIGSNDGDENPFDMVLDGTVETAVGPDVAMYLVSKGRWFAQTGTGTPQLGDGTPYFFYSLVAESPGGSATVNSATVSPPGKSAKTLVRNDFEQSWEYEAGPLSKSSLDSSFPKGTYRFNIGAVNDGTQTPTLTLPSDAYPLAPQVTNWTEAQSLISTADFPLTWNAFDGGNADDFIQLCVYNTGGPEVFCTPAPGEPGALDGTATSAVIPANTLAGNQSYEAELMFVNVEALNTTGYPGAAAYVTQTEFAIQTVVPPPSQGALQFSAAAYRASERDGQVTVTVTRIGGTEGEVQVGYATSDGTADSAADYNAAEGKLTFGQGVAEQEFSITLLNDDLLEGDETVHLTLSNPTGGAVLGTTSTAILTIADDEVTVGPGTYLDSDGDSFTITLSGPGTARIRLDDPDNERGPIESILLTGTTAKSSLSITVKKSLTGDGKVPIGQIMGDGDLKS
ncbi:MAG: choice-of-anchor D domain-containing protein, partial [Pirellulaceae bacterium]|nr:choice-of-anchor D domain-containing protein [Pirellulaceae bacterium]